MINLKKQAKNTKTFMIYYPATMRPNLANNEVHDMNTVCSDLMPFIHVANSRECTTLDDAFTAMNNHKLPLRSMSVGDVILDQDEYKAYMCMPTGWEEVPKVLETIRELEGGNEPVEGDYEDEEGIEW